MENSGEGKGQGRGSPNEASQGRISGLRTWQDFLFQPFLQSWSSLTLNRATPALSDGLVLLNLVGIALGCLQLKNPYLCSKQVKNRQREERPGSSKSWAASHKVGEQPRGTRSEMPRQSTWPFPPFLARCWESGMGTSHFQKPKTACQNLPGSHRELGLHGFCLRSSFRSLENCMWQSLRSLLIQ